MSEKAQVLELNGLRFNVERKHRLRGVLYTFPPGVPINDVPFDVAVEDLSHNDAFEVRDQAGNLIEAMRREESSVPGSAPIVMRVDETIAKYEELTYESLRTRCGKYDDFDPQVTNLKEEMLTFLMEKGASRTPPDQVPVPFEGVEDAGAADGELEHED